MFMNLWASFIVILGPCGAQPPVANEPLYLVAADSHALEPEVYAALEDTGSGGTVKVANRRCENVDTGCPAGTLVLTPDGYYLGCNSSCTGSCRACSGDLTPVDLCKPATSEECVFPSAGGSAKCGKLGSGTCATAPAGGGDARGCDCVGLFTYGTEDCRIKMCG